MKETIVKALKAFHGDCFIIKTYDADDNDFIILVDGGPPNTFSKALKTELELITRIDLVILTHVCNDHIGGLLKFFQSDIFNSIEIKEYWFNAGNLIRIREGSKVGVEDGVELEVLLYEKEIVNKWGRKIVFTNKNISLAKGVNCKVLSPNENAIDELIKNWPYVNLEKELEEEDDGLVSSETSFNHPLLDKKLSDLARVKFKKGNSLKDDYVNSSSIAFILEAIDCKLLFLGDSRSEIVEEALASFYPDKENRPNFDLVKVSHHGSKFNTTIDFISQIECNNFIISTNGGYGRSKHPDRETIARIVCNPNRQHDKKINLYFNYPQDEIYSRIGKFIDNSDEIDFQFSCVFDCGEINVKKIDNEL